MISGRNLLELVLILLQTFHVLFLWLHDWVPLGRFNDVAALRSQVPMRNLLLATVIQSSFFTVGLFFSLSYFGQPYPVWLRNWLWISYGILFLGELEAWWVPYLVRKQPKRAESYRKMFGNTHAFLPTHNGVVPNTAHTILHLATAATLLVLFRR